VQSKLAAGDCSPSPSPSECGTECGTEFSFVSTACSSSFSEDGNAGRRLLVPSLKDARRALKEQIGAKDRSMRFARGLASKLDELREIMAEGASKQSA
jgi:hypothetical protein